MHYTSLIALSIVLLAVNHKTGFCDEAKSKEFNPLHRITDIIKGFAPQPQDKGAQPAKSSPTDDASERSLPVANDKFKCSHDEGQDNGKNKYLTFENYECTNKKNNNGEYVHIVELADGARHKEEGVVINGEFVIRGYFFSKDDPDNFHIYVKDKKGIHYYILPIKTQGTQEYGIDDDQEEICGFRGDACIDPKVLTSLLG